MSRLIVRADQVEPGDVVFTRAGDHFTVRSCHGPHDIDGELCITFWPVDSLTEIRTAGDYYELLPTFAFEYELYVERAERRARSVMQEEAAAVLGVPAPSLRARYEAIGHTGGCVYATCLIRGRHVHQVCDSCGSFRHVNMSCDECRHAIRWVDAS